MPALPQRRIFLSMSSRRLVSSFQLSNSFWLKWHTSLDCDIKLRRNWIYSPNVIKQRKERSRVGRVQQTKCTAVSVWPFPLVLARWIKITDLIHDRMQEEISFSHLLVWCVRIRLCKFNVSIANDRHTKAERKEKEKRKGWRIYALMRRFSSYLWWKQLV